MVGVEALWQGRCSDNGVQQKLIERIIELDNILNVVYPRYVGEEKSRILYNPEKDDYKVMMSGALFSGQKLPESLKQVDGRDFIVAGIGLFGLTFHIFEPHQSLGELRQSKDSTVSIVFTRSQDPVLDGRMVNPVRLHKHHPMVNEVQMVLETPRLYLNEYLQPWMRNFLGWINQFYLPGMEFWIGNQSWQRRFFGTKESRDDNEEDLVFKALITDLCFELPVNKCADESEVVQNEIMKTIVTRETASKLH